MKRTLWLMAITACIAILGTTLQASALTLTGTVTTPDGYSSEVVAGATLLVMPGNYTAVTGANGNFSITGLSAGTYTITVDAVGRIGYTMDLVLLSDKNVVFSLEEDPSENPVPSWDGTVLGEVPGGNPKPLAGALIRITPGNYTTYTDANGHFDLPNDLAPGTYMVHVKADGYKPINDHRPLPPAQPLQYILEVTGSVK